MILEKKMTEKEYRKLDKLSYSGLKCLSESVKKFYNEYILKEKPEEEDNYSFIMGTLVDVLVLRPDDFDEFFTLATCVAPVGQMLDLTNNLYKRTLRYTNEEGVVQYSFETIFEEAFRATAFDNQGAPVAFKGKTVEKAMDMFIGSDAELYYNQLRASTGKTLITLKTLEDAEKIVSELRSNSNTREVVNMVSGDGIEVHNQLAIEFTYLGVELKSLIDKLIVDNNQKIIYLKDLKTTYSVENFSYSYLKYGYYLQASLYREAVRFWASQNDKGDYQVTTMEFIVADTINWMQPLLYRTSEEDYLAGLQGFSVNNKYYKGVNQLIDEYKFALENGIWNCSKDNYLNNGKVLLDINYDSRKTNR